ncbi:MAG TPA: MFS transporter, partial [Gammaproteobacteria bacterium]|nr:MFS transporter [Gammaproteobacteria bacterium]
ADLTREEHRTKAMATVGASIGFSFLIAMVAGPALAGVIGVPGIFWLIAGLAVAAVAFLYAAVPRPTRSGFHREAEAVPALFGRMLRDGQLLRLDFGVMTLHLVLTASFVVLPLALRDAAGLAPERHWLVYLPVMVLAMAAAVPFIIVAERKRRMKPVFLAAIAVLAVAELGILVFHGRLLPLAFLLWLFFAAFTLLEATLPSLLSKEAPADAKGTAMGVYSSSQFLGAFIGGAAGGGLYGFGGFAAVFAFCTGLILLWLGWAASMRPPRYLTATMIHVAAATADEAERLRSDLAAVEGVMEVAVHPEDGVAYLKVDAAQVDEEALARYAEAGPQPA